MTTTPKRHFGDMGEKAAAAFLINKGYDIIDLNFQNNFGRRMGEIDIIARDNGKKELVFIEVKTRDSKKYGLTLPEENVTYQKLRKMQKMANFYMRQKGLENDNYRFDAISVWLDLERKNARIKHIKGL